MQKSGRWLCCNVKSALRQQRVLSTLGICFGVICNNGIIISGLHI